MFDTTLFFVIAIVLVLQFFAVELQVVHAADAVAKDAKEATKETTNELSFEKAAAEKGEKHSFNAEVNKLMQIIINSLYTNNEVFLRELISNASDALDKIRFLALTNAKLLGEGDTAKLEILIKGDEASNTLTITDRGVGMTKKELIANLGTIAQSGTKDFLKKFQEYSDSNLIGQFGVGFYSVFLVADSVTVVSKSNDDADQWVWQSTADGSFTVSKDPRGNTLGRGTQLIIHLKEDATEYAKVDTLKRLVAKYSEFIHFPISLWTTKDVTEDVPMNEEELAEQLKLERDGAADEKDDAAEEEEEVDLDAKEKTEHADGDEATPKKTTKSVTKQVADWEVLNAVKPLWMRPEGDVSDDEYKEFYKSTTKDYQAPLKWAHFSAEGEIEFKALLYIPATQPPGMFDGSGQKDNMRLFVRRVFITDDFSDILPKYLSFIKGLVDSDDLPLNVSREQLQQHKTLKIIKKKLIRKAIAMFQELQQAGGDNWEKFYSLFATNIKLGVIEDTANRARLAKLLQFHSTKTGNLTTLTDYVTRMKKGQDQIYYIGGESVEALRKSPLLERLIKRGFEVLLMTDPIDEYCVQNMAKFDGKFAWGNVGKEGLKLPEDEKFEEAQKDLKEQFKPLFDWLKEQLPDELEKVVLSKRLTSSPSAIVSSQYGYSANMQRIIKNQALGDPSSRNNYMMSDKHTMELNANHPIVKTLLAHVVAGATTDDDKAIAQLLVETAKLQSGFDIADPRAFADAVARFVAKQLGVQDEAIVEFDEAEAPDAVADDADADEVEEEEGAVGEAAGDGKDEL